jgi:hypothetical protein
MQQFNLIWPKKVLEIKTQSGCCILPVFLDSVHKEIYFGRIYFDNVTLKKEKMGK